MMERRSEPRTKIEIRAKDGGKPAIEGYGALHYDGTPDTEYVLWDDAYGRAVERVIEGAFEPSYRDDDVRGMYNHEKILARTTAGTMRLAVDKRGLRYEIDAPDTSVGRDVVESIRRGDVTGSSFAFSIPPEGQRWTETTDKDGKVQAIRELLKVTLFDTGPVDFPAYANTTTAVRAVGDVTEARAAFEKWKATPPPPPPAPAGPSYDQVRTRARVAEIETAMAAERAG